MRTINKRIFAALTTALMVFSVSPVSTVFAENALAATTPPDENAQVECSDPSCDIDESEAAPPETAEPADTETSPEAEQPTEPKPVPAPAPKPRPKPAPLPVAPVPVIEAPVPEIAPEAVPEPEETPPEEASAEEAPLVVVSAPPIGAAVAPDPVSTTLTQVEAQSGLSLAPGKSIAEVAATDLTDHAHHADQRHHHSAFGHRVPEPLPHV